jgi:heptosyltransferase-2/heptosyltransferase-3
MRYLVFALQGLGDSLEATVLVRALRNHDPSAQIDVAVTRRGPAHLFAGIPTFVADVIYLPYWERGLPSFALSLARSARRQKYDASFMAYPSAKPAYHVVNAAFRADRKFGHRYADPKLSNALWSYTDLVPIRACHNVERNLDLISAAGIPQREPTDYIVPPSWFGDGERDRSRVTIHVGTIAHDGFENKRWPLDSFAVTAQRLQDAGYEISLLAGPEEREETSRLAARVPGSKLFTGSLDQAAVHLATSALVLTNDSGIGHLAAAVKTPVVSLFGPTPTTGAPYGPTSSPIRTSPCPPCFDPLSRGISCVLDIDYRCLKVDLTAEHVLQRVYAALGHASIDV